MSDCELRCTRLSAERFEWLVLHRERVVVRMVVSADELRDHLERITGLLDSEPWR